MAEAKECGIKDLSMDECFEPEVKGHTARILSTEEADRLNRDSTLVSDFKRKKYEIQAQKNWDLFYKRNTTKFFKDRHWTKREFGELFEKNSTDERKKIVLEVGCGVGNFVFPLLEEYDNIYFYACDFSPRAVQFVKDNPQYDPERCSVFQCDITVDDLTSKITANSVDVVTMVFVLSAIHPDKMAAALHNIYKVIKPGGCLLFRDYGLYDHAQLRFAPGHKLSENFYVRQDGTRAYYFSLEVLTGLVTDSGYKVISCEYCQRETVNRKEGICVPRIFVQGKFEKPYNISSPDRFQETTMTESNQSKQKEDENCANQTENQTCNLNEAIPESPVKIKMDVITKDSSTETLLKTNHDGADHSSMNASKQERFEMTDGLFEGLKTSDCSSDCSYLNADFHHS